MDSLIVLELNKIIDILKAYAVSELGMEEISRIVPSTNIEKVNTLLEETEDAQSVLKRTGKNPVDTFPDVLGILEHLHATYMLNPSEILRVCRCLFVSRMCKKSIETEIVSEGNTLNKMAVFLVSERNLEEEINRCILSEEEIADNASEELRRIRRQINLTNEHIRDRMNSMIKSQQHAKYLQEPIITIRNGRYTLAVKAEYRGQIAGLIHDVSGSGSTLFVEPAAVVELGNELKKLAAEEQKEIERILANLTAKIAMISDALYTAVLMLSKLDCIFARARLSMEWRAVRPILNTDNRIDIKNGRHPLLKTDVVVPISFRIGNGYNTLVITGPNTGGKTVTLKTVGLFTLMTECGLFVPADNGSEIAIFDDVFADIGDEQSIEQSLSTFSSHMKNLVYILSKAESNSLVLLDELGAGTDPTEGAALAQSILKSLTEAGATTVATTHYSEVKAYAMTEKNMINASMEFDTEKLAPTYRLLIGVPGRSNAFEISKKLGLKDEIISYAETRIHEKDKDFENILSEAESMRLEANREREAANQMRQESEQILQNALKDKEQLDADKIRIREKAKEEARQIVRDTKESMELLIREIRESVKNSHETEKTIQNARDGVRERESILSVSDSTDTAKYVPLKKVMTGQCVHIISMDQDAVVLKEMDGKGRVSLQCGSMKLLRPISDLSKAEKKERKQAKKERIELHQKERSFLELDLRGFTVDDAIIEIDRFIDDANLSSIHEISIIHGKGTGALREGVQQYLKKHPMVKSYRIGAYGEGDAGVTVVTLKG